MANCITTMNNSDSCNEIETIQRKLKLDRRILGFDSIVFLTTTKTNRIIAPQTNHDADELNLLCR